MSLKESQPLIIKTIDNMIKKARIPQAFIYYGESGTDKKAVCKYFIKELYKSYLKEKYDLFIEKRIDDENHINITYVKRDKETVISKDQVEELIVNQIKTSLEEGPRVFVIEDAQYLNKSSMNELLKFIEEPVDDTYIILLIDNLSLLQDTIISRCSLFHFVKEDISEVKNKLKGLASPSIVNAFATVYQNIEVIKENINDNDKLKVFESIVDMFKEDFINDGSLILYFKEHKDILDIDKELYVSFLSLYLEDIMNVKYNMSLTYIDEESYIRRIRDHIDDKTINEALGNSLEIKRLVVSKKPINLELYIINLLLDIEMKARSK